tara:strand:- start:63 stop:350 length:288 start_codon:yes stop_codon:yes gene_type:complete
MHRYNVLDQIFGTYFNPDVVDAEEGLHEFKSNLESPEFRDWIVEKVVAFRANKDSSYKELICNDYYCVEIIANEDEAKAVFEDILFPLIGEYLSE